MENIYKVMEKNLDKASNVICKGGNVVFTNDNWKKFSQYCDVIFTEIEKKCAVQKVPVKDFYLYMLDNL